MTLRSTNAARSCFANVLRGIVCSSDHLIAKIWKWLYCDSFRYLDSPCYSFSGEAKCAASTPSGLPLYEANCACNMRPRLLRLCFSHGPPDPTCHYLDPEWSHHAF
jgi:hypothetical protein